MQTITIEARFCGPPTSGNGGVVAGRLAAFVPGEGGAVEVTLSAPPPLETPLQVVVDGDGTRLLDGDVVVASARRVEPLVIDVPAPVTPEEARRVTERSVVLRGPDAHPFPTCFVCGPAREPGDGLRLFPAQLSGRDEFVAEYVPRADDLATEFTWAALDCPSSFPMYLDSDPLSGAYVLGRMTAEIGAALTAGASYVVTSWRERAEGRKLLTAVALFDAEGAVVAKARATWIRVQA